jgi:RNA polymerase sigma factor (sigma-70 family)
MQRTATPPDLGLELAPGLVRLAWRLAGAADAEDLVQATYLRALEHEGTVREPRSWLRRVLRNERSMSLRSRRRRDQREAACSEKDAAVDLEHVVHCLEVARLVDRLIDELDEDVRMVVRERYFDGHSAAEIARRHAIPAGTVRWRLKLGLDRLRDELDARHGGRRMLWAGGFAPLATSPTPWPAAASRTPNAGGTAAAAMKGASIMSIEIKLLLGAGIIATTGATAAYVGTRGGTEPPAAVASAAATGSPRFVPAVAAASAPSAEAAAPTRPPGPNALAWAQRRSMIFDAHGIDVDDPEFSWTPLEPGTENAAAGAEPRVGTCTDPGCIERLTREVAGMVDGCRELMADVAPDVSLVAKVVGAPDVGTIIESVELAGGTDAPADLRECLTETMYTLELGATEKSFAQTITVLLGGPAQAVLDGMRGPDGAAPPQLEAALEAARERGDEGRLRMIFVDDGKSAPADE